jgi:F-type H+-transporting ATPase subunit a
MLLGLFTNAIQVLVFSTLAGAYIGEALEDHSTNRECEGMCVIFVIK